MSKQPFQPEELLRKYSRKHIIKKLLSDDEIVDDIWDYVNTRFVRGSNNHVVYRTSVDENDIKVKMGKSTTRAKKSISQTNTIVNDSSVKNNITNITVKNEEKQVVVYSAIDRTGKLYLVHNTGYVEVVQSGVMPDNVRLFPMKPSDIRECRFSVDKQDIKITPQNGPETRVPTASCYILYDGKFWIIASGGDIYMIAKGVCRGMENDYGLDYVKKFFRVT